MARSRPGGRCGGPAASARPAARTLSSTTSETKPTTLVGVFIQDLLSGRSEVAPDPVRSVCCEYQNGLPPGWDELAGREQGECHRGRVSAGGPDGAPRGGLTLGF